MNASSQSKHFFKMRENVKSAHLDPIVELIQAATSAVESAERRAQQAEIALEVLRPVWAQGWSDDSSAAQAASNALSELWHILGAKNQTYAVEKLRNLIANQ